MKACKKLEKMLDAWINPEKPSDRPKNITVCMIDAAWSVYQELKHTGKADFLISDLIPYFEKCGLVVTEKGRAFIGYTASYMED